MEVRPAAATTSDSEPYNRPMRGTLRHLRFAILLTSLVGAEGRSLRAQVFTPIAPAPASKPQPGQPGPPLGQPLGQPLNQGRTVPTPQGPTLTPVPTPVLSPQVVELIKLESRFSDDVAKGGGQAFASWFAEDGVTLSNGKPPVLGHAAIAAAALWDPKVYQLTWYAEGAQMGPAGDTGFTWGHYDAVTTLADGKSTTTSGRYITFWKKVKGDWKVALEASADDPPAAAN